MVCGSKGRWGSRVVGYRVDRGPGMAGSRGYGDLGMVGSRGGVVKWVVEV